MPESSEVAQRYKVDVLLDQDFIDEDDLDAPYFLRGMILGKNVQVTSEYTDYAVFQAIAATVDGWVEGLPRKKPSRVVSAVQRAERPIRHILPNAVRLLALISGAVYLTGTENLSSQLISAILLIAIALGLTSADVVSYFVEGLYRLLVKFKPATFLCLTEGDRDRMVEVLKSRNKILGHTSFLLIMIGLTILLNVLSNVIYEALFG